MRHGFYLVIILIALSQSGCSSFGQKLKSFISGKDNSNSNVSTASNPASSTPSFSKISQLDPGTPREYKRMTKKNLEDSSRLDSKSGSLWVMEGQGAYLFSQNIVRMIGDTLVVKLEGEPREQLETKVKVINDLLKRLERRRIASERAKKESEEGKAKKEKKTNDKPANAAAAKTEEADNPKDSELKVNNVTTRIVERLIDGNYRIKGSQPFMIGKREYKVIVTGIIRSEDFNEEGVSATAIVDPKFDIVSVRKGRL